jgi:hypothetical protein
MGDLRNDAQVIDCALVVARACLAAPDPPTKATAIVAARANELSVFRFVNRYDLLLERDGVFHNPHSPILLQPAVDGKLQPQNRRGDFRSRSLTSYVDKSSREHRLPTGGSPVEMTETADLKSAGHPPVQVLYKWSPECSKTPPKCSATILIAQQHAQNWVDS